MPTSAPAPLDRFAAATGRRLPTRTERDRARRAIRVERAEQARLSGAADRARADAQHAHERRGSAVTPW